MIFIFERTKNNPKQAIKSKYLKRDWNDNLLEYKTGVQSKEYLILNSAFGKIFILEFQLIFQ